MNTLVYLNGQFMPKAKAFISPDDRGFCFADGVYEVIKYYKGKAFGFCDHLIRLKQSLAGAKIRFTGINKLEELCNELIRLNKMGNEYAGVYLQFTRGVYQRMHRFPDETVKPTVYINTYLLAPFIQEIKYGIKVILREDIRWHRCDIKSIMLLPNVLMYEEAVKQGAGECFFIRDGYITESTHSNIFAVKKDIIYTHPDSNHVLPGITKKAVLRICKRIGIVVKEDPVRADEANQYDEFFISGTGSEVMPVIQLENMFVKDGKPGPVTRRIQHEFFRATYGEIADDWDFKDWIG
ncbi:MAG: aminotransferase class IV [Bacteroidales bacterium]|nr:aminotransferase class IV [Bacteroidales bacterium]